MIKRYRMNPAHCEALQFTGLNSADIRDFTGAHDLQIEGMTLSFTTSSDMKKTAVPGDYVIKFHEIDDLVDTCSAEMFEAAWTEDHSMEAGEPVQK